MGREVTGMLSSLPTELGIRATGSESSQLPKGRRGSRIKFSFDVSPLFWWAKFMCGIFFKIFQQNKSKNLEECIKQDWEMLGVVEAE